MALECDHGQLARQCEICQLQAENAELKQQVSDLRKELEQAKSYLRGVEKERTEFMLQVAEMRKRLAAAEAVCHLLTEISNDNRVLGSLWEAHAAWRSQATEEGS